MLIVVSSPHPVADEAQRINLLFEAGMQRFHLRKPESSIEELRTLLQAIKPVYYSRIALHQHHLLAAELGLQRLHFTEATRRQTSEEIWQQLVNKGCQISTSIHSLKGYTTLSTQFSYAFIGPVFTSISKSGYSAGNLLNELATIKQHHVLLIAIGGITSTNCTEPLKAGCKGVAVLGTIWQNNNPLENFNHLKTHLDSKSVICHPSSAI